MKLWHLLSQWLFPPKCVLCGGLLEKNETDLCHKCRVNAPDCPVLRAKYPYLHSWVALWYYEDDVRSSLLRYKFYGKRGQAEAYGRLLGMKLMREDLLDFDILTFVPISDKRRRKRGFDQVQLLAEKLGDQIGKQPQPLLKKLRDNPAQSGIVGQAERRANVLGVYEVVHPEQVIGKRILLLDDIVTTGATASECARVLLTVGAKEVSLAVVAAARQHKKVSK
jgi:ComF family protein